MRSDVICRQIYGDDDGVWVWNGRERRLMLKCVRRKIAISFMLNGKHMCEAKNGH
jgi:hypothetical protein